MSAAVEPTPDQLAAMAYVDGELSGPEREAFAARLSGDSALRLEVSELRGLAVLARATAPPEPADHEWERMKTDPLHRVLHTGGMWAFFGGVGCAIAGAILGALGLELEPLSLLARVGIPVGLVSLLVAAVRWRGVELPHDPYVKVRR